MNKEIEEALDTLVTLPLRIPKPFSLKDVWNEPMITLTEELVDMINRGGYLQYTAFDNEESRTRLIGSKCYAVIKPSRRINEEELKEILTNGSQKDKNRLILWFDDEDEIVDDIVSSLISDDSYNVRWRVALGIRLYVENGGDLAELVKDVESKYPIERKEAEELSKKQNAYLYS